MRHSNQDLRSDQPIRLPVVGQALRGHPYVGTTTRGVAVRITTGAVLPDGPDAVVIQELMLDRSR